MKILFIDIETSPNLVWSFDLRNAFIGIEQIVSPSRMLCFSATWYGSDEDTEFRSEFHDGAGLMLDRLWALEDEADVIVHFNGQKFDEPKINAEFYRARLKPPSPYQRVDLWKVISKRFSFPSSKLDWVLRESELPLKVQTGGFSLWKGCLEGDPDSWDLMREYNVQDTEAMIPLYERMLPWISDHPSWANFLGEFSCPNCGSIDLAKRGFARTKQSTFQRYQCGACGTWSQDTRRVSGASIRQVAA